MRVWYDSGWCTLQRCLKKGGGGLVYRVAGPEEVLKRLIKTAYWADRHAVGDECGDDEK